MGAETGWPGLMLTPVTSVLFVLSAVACLAMAGAAWRLRQSTNAAPALVLVLCGLAAWASIDLVDLLVATQRDEIPRFSVWALPAVTLVVAGLCWMCRALTDPLWRPSRRVVRLAAIEPVLLSLLVVTSPWHSLLIDSTGRGARADLHFGAAFWVHAAYSYLLLASGLGRLLWRRRSASPTQRRQFTVVLAVAGFPVVGNIVTLWRGPGSVDLSTLPAVLTASVTFWAIFRQGVFEVLPIARARILEKLSDALVVLDDQDRLVDTNEAARDLLRSATPAGQPLLGMPAQQALGGLAGLAGLDDGEYRCRLGVTEADLDLRTMQLTDRRGRRVGRVLIARDVSAAIAQRELMLYQNATLTAQLHTIEVLRDELADQALRDELTGLHNRRYLRDFLGDAFRIARSSGLPLSLVMIDVDYFKSVNDQYGHPVGDRVLQRLAHTLTTCLQPGDLAIRHGGEEFVVVLPGCDLAAAVARAEELRRACEQEMPLRDAVLHTTISAGVAALHDGIPDGEALLEQADWALYDAKANGRNRVGICTAHVLAQTPAQQASG